MHFFSLHATSASNTIKRNGHIDPPRSVESRRTPMASAIRLMPCLLLLVITACASDSSGPSGTQNSGDDYLAQQGSGLFNAPEGGTQASAQSSWSIFLAAFAGPDQAERAAQILQRLHTEVGLTAARVAPREERTLLVYGRYPDPTSEQAKRDLARVREANLDGQTLFPRAFMMPPPTSDAESLSEFDLRSVKYKYAADNALYSMLVGVYAREDQRAPTSDQIKEFRAAAEEAVRTLRRDGYVAWFWHSPTKSHVLVGVFGVADWDPLNNPGYESPAIQAIRAEFPRALLNGRAWNMRVPGKPRNDPDAFAPVKSYLIRIPD